MTLLTSEMPAHNHFLNADTGTATASTPAGGLYMSAQASDQGVTNTVALYTSATPNTQLSLLAVSLVGNSSPHNNMMPYLTLNFCIAMQGVFPARG